MKDMKLLMFFLFCVGIFSPVNGYSQLVNTRGGIPVLDLTKDYPQMKFVVDNYESKFVLLDTTKEVADDIDFKLVYASNNRIVGANRRRGDIFVFDGDGKIVSAFKFFGNGIGSTGLSVVFDEVNKEIFVANLLPLQNNFVVFSEEGKFLRRFSLPISWISDFYNFDEQTLLAYNQYDADAVRLFGNVDCINSPYLLISKNDGNIVSRLNLSLSERISDSSFGNNSRIKFGQEYVFVDRSSDTTFLLVNEKLTPLFVRTPSVLEQQEIIIKVRFKTDTHLYFDAVLIENCELADRRPIPYNPPTRNFVFDLNTGQLFSLLAERGLPSSVVDSPEKNLVRSFSTDNEQFVVEIINLE